MLGNVHFAARCLGKGGKGGMPFTKPAHDLTRPGPVPGEYICTCITPIYVSITFCRCLDGIEAPKILAQILISIHTEHLNIRSHCGSCP